MYQKVLVPLDGSELAEQVLPYGVLIAKAFSSQVALLRVFESVPIQWAGPAHGRYLDQITSSFRDHAIDYLEAIAAPLRQEGLTVTCTAHVGSPADQIIDEATREPETLIAMSTHGRSGINRWIMGSVTDKVLHGADTPLLIVRSKDGGRAAIIQLDSIIVPLDGSDLSERVLPHAVSLARALGADVTLLRTTHVPFYDLMNYPPSMYDALRHQATAEAEEYLRHTNQQISTEGVEKSRTQVKQGDAAGAILDLAGNSSSTLIAMCTHGHSRVGRWVLGSVTDRVVRHSGGPVLVVRTNEAKSPGAGTILL